MEGGLLLPQSTNGATAHGGDGNAKPPTATAVLVFSTSVALCGSLTTGCAMGYSSPAESGIREDAALSLSAYSMFSSALIVGGMIGASFSGKLSDLIGRRAAMGLSQVFAFFGWLAIAFSQWWSGGLYGHFLFSAHYAIRSNVWWLDIGRLSVGIGMGVLAFVVPVYITEITPKSLRGSFTAAFQLLTACGVSLMFFVGTIVNWRVLALIGAIPSLMQVFGLFFIPESPRWLANFGRDEELESTLRRLRGKSADISEEYVAIREYTEAFQHVSHAGIMNLFQRRYARSLTVGIGLVLLQQFGGCNAILSFASSIFESADFSSNVGTIGIAIIQIPSTLMGVLLMDKVGRRPLLLVSGIGMFLSCFLVASSFLLQDFQQLTTITPVLVFIGIMIYSTSFTVGLAGIVFVIVSEIFPINIKGSAGSLVSVVNWLCALATVYSFNFVAEWSSAGPFLLFSCVNGLGVLFVVKLVPETMGRSIEEIQASITHLR